MRQGRGPMTRRQGATRRSVIAAGGSALVLSMWTGGAGAVTLPPTIRVYVPYGRGSLVAIACQLLSDPLSALLSRRVEIDIPPLPDRMQRALQALQVRDRGELRLLASDTLLHVMYDAQEAARGEGSVPSLDALVPVATLTGGYSTALFVSAESPARDWESFASMARERTMSVASSNPGGVHLRFLERVLDQGLGDVLASGRQDIFEDVLTGKADCGLINTPSLAAYMRANPGRLRAIITFGGERNGELNVPTLREVSGNRAYASTNSVGLFAAAGTPADVVEELHAALLRAAEDKAVVQVVQAMGLPLKINDAADLRATVERDRAVVAESGL